MTLPALSLDDLTYEDLRQMAMRQIPAASGGRWTHHEPVDAGVTLLELFAFLLEQQLFVLDQVPDGLTHALLALLGEALADAGVARTLVAPPLPVDDVTPLPGGTVLMPSLGGLGALAFSTEADLLLLPVESERVFADGEDVTDRIARGEAVAVMAGDAAALSLEARFKAPLQIGAENGPYSIAVLLAESGVPAEWEAGATDVAPPAPLSARWQTDAAQGVLTDWQDGTAGLRRSGLLRFPMPAAAEGAERLAITLTGDPDAFAAPPRLQNMLFNAGVAAHRRRIELNEETSGPTLLAYYETLRAGARALLPNSGQVLELPRDLVPVLAATIELALTDRTGAFQDWTRVNDRTGAERDARVFTFDRDFGRFEFGDGIAGRVAAPADDIRLVFDIGGGSEGNHVAGMEWTAEGRALVSITDATGGAEPETLDAARARVAAGLSQRHRAVTADDYITLTETTSGIAAHRAHVAAGFDPTFPCHQIADTITVFVVPHTGPEHPAPKADAGAMAAIRERLDATRMLTTRVIVAHPVIRPIDLTVELAAAGGTTEEYAAQLRPVLSTYLHPTLGGAAGTGWPFGGALRPSELLRVAADALGDLAPVERVAIRFSDQPDSREEDCTELELGAHRLVSLDALRIRLRAARPMGPTL